MIWGYGMWWGSLMWLILLGTLVWVVTANAGTRRTQRPGALEILEERFARGEIDSDTYRSTKTELERN